MSHFNMIDTDRLLLTKRIFKDTEYPKISINERVGILDDFFLSMSKHDQQVHSNLFRNLSHKISTKTANNIAYEMEEDTACNDMINHGNNDINSSTANMSQLSQELGNHDIHDLQNSVCVKKKRQQLETTANTPYASE